MCVVSGETGLASYGVDLPSPGYPESTTPEGPSGDGNENDWKWHSAHLGTKC